MPSALGSFRSNWKPVDKRSRHRLVLGNGRAKRGLILQQTRSAIAHNRCRARAGAVWRPNAPSLVPDTPSADLAREESVFSKGGGGVRAEWQEWHETLAGLQRSAATATGS